ncbi:hypothetical protein SB48_HM08orf05807 [Heyndrickxia coagulans]|uniref:Uncharacterized protein n=1 Tax=Heyndrickxia coagulans TaxID=1398 RepID=A0AAN0T9Z0_HEYCO|nr:hypothetical protein SB48_HM08orf05807 [Heyndrickxia coagulans]
MKFRREIKTEHLKSGCSFFLHLFYNLSNFFRKIAGRVDKIKEKTMIRMFFKK